MEAEISGAIKAIASSIQLVQTAARLAKETRNAELIEAIADLRVELSQAKIAAANANEQIADLVVENRKLKENLEKLGALGKEKLVLGKDGLYYTTDGNGPFCTVCYDSAHETIRVIEQVGHFRIFGKYRCSICNTPYGGS